MATKKTASEKYGYYIEQLDNLFGKDYMSLFRSVYERIVNENEDKIKTLLKRIEEIDAERNKFGILAIQELTPYYERLVLSLKGKEIDGVSQYWINFAEGARLGEVFSFGNGLADLLFEAFRKVLEKNPQCGYLEELLLYRVLDKSAYVSWDSVKLIFPNYYKFYNYNKRIDSHRDSEPWGDYFQLNFYYQNIIGFEDQSIDASKNSIKKHLLKFLNYLDSDNSYYPKEKEGSTVIAEIKNLFILKYSPDGIQYTGENKVTTRFSKASRKSQPFATLLLTYNKFMKRKSLDSTKIALSYTEIDDCLSDSKKCNQPLMASSTVNRKRKLDLLLSNIRKKVAFTHDEAYVSGDAESDSPKLNLEVRKNK